MSTSFICSNCGRQIPEINRVIHEVQCKEKKTVNQSEPLPINAEMLGSAPEALAETGNRIDAHNANDISTERPTSQFWECSVCTFHNFDLRSTACEMCGASSAIYSSGVDTASRTADSDSIDKWECSHCTCLNAIRNYVCQACEEPRSPIEARADQLVDDSIIYPASLNTASESHFWQQTVQSAFFRESFSNFPARNNPTGRNEEDRTSALISSTVFGAGIGAGVAFLQRRSIFSGAMEGAGLGLLGGLAVEALSETASDTSRMTATEIHQRSLPLHSFLNLTANDNSRLRDLFELSLTNNGSQSVGMTPDQLNSLPVRSYCAPVGSSPQSCSICLEEFATDDSVRTLPCLHIFHLSCVDTWLSTNASCPVCKTVITSS